MKVEFGREGRLYDLEIRRHIEIARYEQAVMSNVQDLIDAVLAISPIGPHFLNIRQDRIAYGLKRFRDQP